MPNPAENLSSVFPRRLSETGLFASVPELTPAPGVLPYSINADPWADHAISERLVAVPGSLTVKPSGISWSFPKDSVLAKTLKVEVGDRVEIKAFSHLEGVKLSSDVIVGPFARLRPGTVIDSGAKIGNF